MAAAVGRIGIPPHGLSCSSSSKNYLHPASFFQWQTSSHKLLGGASMRCLRGAAKSHRKNAIRQSGGAGGHARAEEQKYFNPFEDRPEDDDEVEFGDLMSEGKQTPEPSGLVSGKRNEYGFLDFPAYYIPEMSTLGLYIRGDVRRCLCWVAGGVYENLLFFPTILLLRNRYPGVIIDVVAGERGKQVYEMNKYISRAFSFNTDDGWTNPADLTEFIGQLRNDYYDMILSTKYAGFKHGATLFMVGGRTKVVSYVPSYHSEWVSERFLTEAIVAPRENLAEGGYNMYEQMLAYLAQPGRGVPQEEIPELQVGVSKRVRAVVREKENAAGLTEGKFVVFHGIQSDSAASMTSRGDLDSLLPLQFWGQLTTKLHDTTGMKVAVVIPHEKEREKVHQACGADVSIVFITTPGQLGSLIRDSAGVVSTNTAAMQMAAALKKPSVALFGSAEKASLFVPPKAQKIKVVASRTGKLEDVDIDETLKAWRFVSEGQLVLAS